MFVSIKKPSGGDIVLLEGTQGRRLKEVFAHYKAGQAPTARMLEEGAALVHEIFGNYPITFYKSDDFFLKEEGGRLADDANIGTASIHFVRDEKSNRKDCMRLAQSRSNLTANGFSYTSRPFPIFVHFDHVSERFAQRANPDKGDDLIRDIAFSLPLAMNMAFLLHEFFEDHEIDEKPVVIPSRAGMYLGIARRSSNQTTLNRIQDIVALDPGKFKIGNYAWIPNVDIEINTFIGLPEIRSNPDQIRLRQSMMKWVNFDKPDGAGASFAFYQYSALTDMMENYSEAQQSEIASTLNELDHIMQSGLWKRTVRFPSDYAKIDWSKRSPR